MSVSTPHPSYVDRAPEWGQMRDTHQGERAVKEASFKYLPPTSGMLLDGAATSALSIGFQAYNAYRMRARFPDHVTDATEAYLGIMHHKPPEIQLPAALEPMRLNATSNGESLEMLLRKINEEQIVVGRLGLHADPIEGTPAGTTPMIVLYPAETILNWDEGPRATTEPATLNMVVLDESGFERDDDFTYKWENRYRVLSLGDFRENEGAGENVQYGYVTLKENETFNPDDMEIPSMAGKPLNSIPFVFINSKDIVSEPDVPPLLGLSNICLAIYRGEADYRQALFMQGQDTLVVIGGGQDKDWRTGAGAVINLPQGQGVDAKYIGVDSTGLSEMREALENLEKQAAIKGGQAMETMSKERESGDALKIRVAARTATLNQIALAGAFGLEQLLKKVAVWMGADPDEVIVTPNLDFVDEELSGATLVEYMSARTLGLPYSLLSIHTRMKEKGLTNMTFEEEVAQMVEEASMDLGSATQPDPLEEEEEDEPT